MCMCVRACAHYIHVTEHVMHEVRMYIHVHVHVHVHFKMRNVAGTITTFPLLAHARYTETHRHSLPHTCTYTV